MPSLSKSNTSPNAHVRGECRLQVRNGRRGSASRLRTTHIHYKVFLDETTVLTSQIFFDETVNQAIYDDHDAYERPEARDMLNAADSIAAEAGQGAYATVRMTEPDGAMEAALVVGINPEGGSSGLLDWLWKRG